MQVGSSDSDCDIYFSGAQFECYLGLLTVSNEVSSAFHQSLQGSASAIRHITPELFAYRSKLITHYLFCHLMQNHLSYELCQEYAINKYHTVNPFVNYEDKLLVTDSIERTRVGSVEMCYGIHSGIGNWLGSSYT